MLAADQHLTALAQAMKAAGQPGTLDILRAWAYLHLLSGKPPATLLRTAEDTTAPVACPSWRPRRPWGQARGARPAVPMPEHTSPRHRAPAVTGLIRVPPGPARTVSPAQPGCAAWST